MVEASSGNIRRLTSVWRYGSIPISIPENVSDHSFWVTLYSAMIHRQLQQQATESQKENYGKSSVFLSIMLKAISHDMGEAVTGDVVRPFKYSSKKLKNAIDEAEEKLLKSSMPDEILDIPELADWLAFTEKADDYVHAVVKAADFMSLYQFMRREVLRGNCEVRDFVGRMVEDLSNVCMLSGAPYPVNDLGPFYKCLENEARKLHGMTVKTRGKSI